MSIPAHDDRTAKVLVFAVVMLLGLLPATMAVRMIRRRWPNMSRDGTRVLEGRPAVVAGWIVLVLIGLCYVNFSYAIAQTWWDFSISRRMEVLASWLSLGLIYGGLFLGLVAAALWRVRSQRLRAGRK